MIKFVNFRASDIEPNPNEVLYWVDLNEDPTGGSIKYWNEKGYWLTIRVLEGTLHEFEERITNWVTEELQEQTEWVEDLVHQFDGRIAIIEGDILNLYAVKLDKLIPGYGIEITEDNTINCTVDLSLYRVVAELPTEDIDESKIYIVFDPDGTGTNTHEEYVYVDGKWELLGKYADYASRTEFLQEVEDRKAVDQLLQESITKEISDRLSDITRVESLIKTEEASRIESDTTITDSLNLEIENRTNADSQINLTIVTEVNRLETLIESNNTNLSTKLQEEIERSTAKDTEHDTKISEEVSRATETEEKLTQDLNAEIERSTTIDGTHTNKISALETKATELEEEIDAEVSRATAKETELNEAITNEISRATLKESEIETSLNLFKSTKGQSSGLASLDENGRVPSSQLPSYVDDVIEADTLTAFPETGESGKIYIAKDTNKTYRWSGTDYTEISASLALGETSSTAYAGDKGKANRDAINSLPKDLISIFPLVSAKANTVNLQDGYYITKEGIGYSSTKAMEDRVIPAATTTTAGVMTAADKAKLDAVELNVIDATLEAKDYADELVDNIQVGGRNLLFNSALEYEDSSWTKNAGHGEYTTLDGVKCFKVEHNGDGLYSFSNNINLPEYGEVINSLDVYATTQCTIRLGVQGQDNLQIQISEVNKWIRVSKKQELKGINAYVIYSQTDSAIYFKHVKCELGNIVTDWSPAPEDLELTFTDGTDGSFTVTKGTGKELKVTIGKPATAGTADTATDCVKKTGDTMTGLLTINGTDVDSILELNNNISGGSSAIVFSNSNGNLGSIGMGGTSKHPYYKNTSGIAYAIYSESNLSPVTTNTELTITKNKLFTYTSSEGNRYTRYSSNGIAMYCDTPSWACGLSYHDSLSVNSSGAMKAGIGALGTEGGNITGLYMSVGDAPYVSSQGLFITTDNITFKNNKVWHAGNDGPGSGLYADYTNGALNGKLLFKQFTKNDNEGRDTFLLIADCSSLWQVEIGGHYGFSGTIICERSSGYPINEIINVVAKVGYDKEHYLLFSSNLLINSCIVLYNSKYYVALRLSASLFNGYAFGNWKNTLSTFIQLDVPSGQTLPTGMTIILNGNSYWDGKCKTAIKVSNPITFTGAVTGTYDGSAAKTVNIPAASTRASLGIDTDDAVVFAKVTASGGFWKESDKRLKSNIKPLEHTIEQITSIPTVEFDMNDKHLIGTIAQDIETVVPEVVSESDGIKKVEYSMIGILAIEGIKLLKQEIEDLKKEIELLKNK